MMFTDPNIWNFRVEREKSCEGGGAAEEREEVEGKVKVIQ